MTDRNDMYNEEPCLHFEAKLVPDIRTKINKRLIAAICDLKQPCKIFDWIVLLLFGENLGFDDLQFSYQQNCSTTMCTWLMIESINYFLRNGSNVYSCFMDMRKAFDTVQHSKLFQKLNQRNLSSIFTRLIIVMYVSQSADVRWGKEVSKSFRITNGVKQGAVLSAILFCVYIDGLITKLRRNQRDVGLTAISLELSSTRHCSLVPNTRRVARNGRYMQ